jgi:hypothetical protein
VKDLNLIGLDFNFFKYKIIKGLTQFIAHNFNKNYQFFLIKIADLKSFLLNHQFIIIFHLIN